MCYHFTYVCLYLSYLPQWLNSHPDNRYERYELAMDWNRTREEPARASDIITIDSCIKLIKMLFGEQSDPNDPDVLMIPLNWGSDNGAYITENWIHPDKLNQAHRVELQMTQHNFDDQNDDSSDDEV